LFFLIRSYNSNLGNSGPSQSIGFQSIHDQTSTLFPSITVVGNKSRPWLAAIDCDPSYAKKIKYGRVNALQRHAA